MCMKMSETKADVYGQVHPHETMALAEAKLDEFESVLDKIPPADKPHVCEAEQKCPELLTADFKLMFLRCEVFNVDLAVKRYVKYWAKRVYVFGPEKAFEPLTLDGALRDDSKALENGFMQLTGTKGIGGRNIIFSDFSVQDFSYTSESMLRAVWYIFHAALEDENTQKFGFVYISYCYNSQIHHLDRKLMEKVASSVQGCIPVRLSGLHFVRPPLMLKVFFPLATMILGKRLISRVKVHSGSDAKAELDKYGLYPSVLPTDVGGEVVLNNHKWLEERRQLGK